jgi:hypothetical protein
MPTGEILNPPIQYNGIWLIIGLCILVILPIWYLVLRWLTRRKKYKAYKNFSKMPEGAELELLKAKYLRLLDQIYQRYTNKAITLRELHRQLSITLRYFVYEAKRVPAPIMTLSDLQVIPYPVLAKLVAHYYAEEFGVIGRGDARSSIETAKGFITEWV